MLSYHRVREAVAAGMLHITHVPGSANPADILSTGDMLMCTP